MARPALVGRTDRRDCCAGRRAAGPGAAQAEPAASGCPPRSPTGRRPERRRSGRRAGRDSTSCRRGQRQPLRRLRRELRQSHRGQDWGEQTYLASDLGRERHAARHRDRAAAPTASGCRPTSHSAPASSTEIDENDIRPQLVDGDWAGAAIAAANGYREALGGSSSTWWWIAGGIVVVGGGGYSLPAVPPQGRGGEPAGRHRMGSRCAAGAPRATVRAQRAGPHRHRQRRYGPANSSSARPSPSSVTTRSRSSAAPSTRPANP